MYRYYLASFIVLFTIIFSPEVVALGSEQTVNFPALPVKDSITDPQLLFNGRIVRPSYSKIYGHEFLFTNEWLTGDVNINDVTFHKIQLKYDIYKDQLVTSLNQITVVQLNKNMIRYFTLHSDSSDYYFENFSSDTTGPVKGFGNILYSGETRLIIKYIKKIQQLAVSNKFDEYYQQQVVYVVKGGSYFKVSGLKDLMNILSDKRQQVQKYIKGNKIKVRKKNPENIIPVLRFYDSLKLAV